MSPRYSKLTSTEEFTQALEAWIRTTRVNSYEEFIQAQQNFSYSSERHQSWRIHNGIVYVADERIARFIRTPNGTSTAVVINTRFYSRNVTVYQNIIKFNTRDMKCMYINRAFHIEYPFTLESLEKLLIDTLNRSKIMPPSIDLYTIRPSRTSFFEIRPLLESVEVFIEIARAENYKNLEELERTVFAPYLEFKSSHQSFHEWKSKLIEITVAHREEQAFIKAQQRYAVKNIPKLTTRFLEILSPALKDTYPEKVLISFLLYGLSEAFVVANSIPREPHCTANRAELLFVLFSLLKVYRTPDVQHILRPVQEQSTPLLVDSGVLINLPAQYIKYPFNSSLITFSKHKESITSLLQLLSVMGGECDLPPHSTLLPKFVRSKGPEFSEVYSNSVITSTCVTLFREAVQEKFNAMTSISRDELEYIVRSVSIEENKKTIACNTEVKELITNLYIRCIEADPTVYNTHPELLTLKEDFDMCRIWDENLLLRAHVFIHNHVKLYH